VTVASGAGLLVKKSSTGSCSSFRERFTLRSGTVSAQICRYFLVSFTHTLRAAALKNQQLRFTDFLAWKAAGLPTET